MTTEQFATADIEWPTLDFEYREWRKGGSPLYTSTEEDHLAAEVDDYLSQLGRRMGETP
jgi:hypothetical protein